MLYRDDDHTVLLSAMQPMTLTPCHVSFCHDNDAADGVAANVAGLV